MATLIQAKVIWKSTKIRVGMVPETELVSMPDRKRWSRLPIKRLVISSKAREYPPGYPDNRGQAIGHQGHGNGVQQVFISGHTCGFMKELKSFGIKFIMYVGGEVEAQLKCMAKVSGGEYFTASGPENFKSALTKVVQKTVAQNLIVSGFDGKDTRVSARVKVLDASSKVIASDTGFKVGFSLPPGEYTLNIKSETMSETLTISNIKVVKDQVTRQKAVFSQSMVTAVLEDHEGRPTNGYIRIVDTRTDQMANGKDHKNTPVSFKVSPGNYQLQMECKETGMTIKSDPFSLAPGQK